MIRFGFTTRLMAIFVVSLIALQLMVVTLYFTERSRNIERPFRFPLPDQIAALVELVEQATSEQRELVLRAANSSDLSVRLSKEKPTLQPETWKPSPFVENALKSYLNLVGERRVTVLLQPDEGAPKRYGAVAMIYPASARIFVMLKTGETLDISTTGVLSIRIFGFPPGFWAGMFGFLIAILVFFSVRGEAKPLRELAGAADKFDLDNGSSPLVERPKGAPEIQTLIRAFNRMQERISILLKARMALVGGISHDLKTLATRLLLRVDAIPDPNERNRACDDIESMIKLLDDAILALQGKFEQGHPEELVDVRSLIGEEVLEWTDRGHSVTMTSPDASIQALVLGRRSTLKRLFANLIDNAIKYGEEARVSVRHEVDCVVVRIDDSGHGIPDDAHETIFEPFVRLETSRNRETGGSGLGLAIVKTIADAHAATLSVGRNERGGARFEVALPRFHSHAG